MKARDVMTRSVRTAQLDTPVAKLAEIMIARRISALPIVDRRRHVIGIVSEGDLLRRAEAETMHRSSWWARLLEAPNSRAREYVKTRGRFARDIMTREVVSVTEDTDVSEIADLLEDWRIKRVPVVRGSKLVGLVSRADLIRAVAQRKPKKRGARMSDVELRDRLRRKLDAASWLGTAFVNFIVRKGEIELFGVTDSAAQRDAIRVMAETVGARRIKDGMSVMARRAA